MKRDAMACWLINMIKLTVDDQADTNAAPSQVPVSLRESPNTTSSGWLPGA
jgi:hypothetical protein